MHRKLFLLFNHTLTEVQKQDAKVSLHVDEFVDMPVHLKSFWEKVPPKGNIDTESLDAVLEWLGKNASSDDFILVQGDFGAVFYIVDYCMKHNLTPIYSTTRRDYKERHLPDEYIESRHVFRHVEFRKYKEWDSKK